MHDSNTLGHHPVLTFHCDPYVQADSTSSLPDVVTNGVLLGIYKSWYSHVLKITCKDIEARIDINYKCIFDSDNI